MTDADESQSLKDLREECRLAWWAVAPKLEDTPPLPLMGGPCRGLVAPYPAEGTTWQGSWFDDAGQQILVTYEINDDGVGEYSGHKTMADIATDVTNAQFDAEREQVEVDLEAMPALEARDFLHLDNERRKDEILETSGGGVDLTEYFYGLECLVLLRHLTIAKGPEFAIEATLDFENMVSLKIDEIEDKFEEQRKALEIAQRQAMLQGQPTGPPQHQGRVTMPPRRIRRG